MASRNYAIAIIVLLAGVAAILSGAIVTSTHVPFAMPDALWTNLHRAIAIAAAAVALLAAVLISSGKSADAKRAIWFACAAFALAAVSGWDYPLSQFEAAWHAVFAHMSTAGVALAAVFLSKSWNAPAVQIDPGPYRALRPAALWTPPVVYLQIVLGAIYRHNMSGVLPHISVAMIVAILTLVTSTLVIQHFSACRPLNRAAVALLTVVLIQICFGIGAFVMRLLDFANTPAFHWIATTHATIGTLVLAASVALAMQAWRYLGGRAAGGA